MKRKTLSGQIYTYFLIVIVLSLLSVGAVSYWQSSRALDDQVKQYMEQMVDSANYQTDSYLQAYELLSNAFSSNSDVRAFMEISRMTRMNIICTRIKSRNLHSLLWNLSSRCISS